MQGDRLNGDFTNRGSVVYASTSADFPDVEKAEIRPVPTLTHTISNMVVYHISDTSDKLQQSKAWKRKIREITQSHQEKILDFFIKPMPEDHPIKKASLLLSKYGKINASNTIDLSRNPPVFLDPCGF